MSATDGPKVPRIAPPGAGTIAARMAAGLGLRPSPLDDRHLSRLAIVYIRQSEPQQRPFRVLKGCSNGICD